MNPVQCFVIGGRLRRAEVALAGALVARATPDERAGGRGGDHHTCEARRLLEEMDIMKVPTVLDVTRADVHHLGRRADALRRVMYELGESWQDGVSLG